MSLASISLLKLSLIAGGSIAGAAVGAAILATSGPLSSGHDETDPQVVAASPTPATPQRGTPTVPSSATPAATPATPTQPPERYPADKTFNPGDDIDLTRLPAADTGSWVTQTGPRGTMTIQIPAGWVVMWGTSYSADDDTGQPFGDTVAINKAIEFPPVGESRAGWVRFDLAVQPVRIPLTPPDAANARGVTLPGSRRISGYQYGPPVDFPNFKGGVDLEVDLNAGGKYVNGYAHADLPASAEDLSILVAILQRLELK